MYAQILLNRLKAAEAEARLWKRQFGFKTNVSTEAALYIVRRRIEQAWAAKNGQALPLAFDWKKAFDSIDPDRLMNALERFGINTPMQQAIRNIYEQRFFQVRDEGEVSEPRHQIAGISQGCPLSPFLF